MKKICKLLLIILMFFGLFCYIPKTYAYDIVPFSESVDTEALLLVNPSNDEILYSKNNDKVLTMASTTKIMTYAVVVDYIDDLENTIIEVKSSSVDKILPLGASLAGFQNHVGESFKAIDLLRGMMIPSGCEAAQILADYIEETYHIDFVSKMNEKASSLNMKDTIFTEVHGISNNNFTTANDMYYLAKYANDLPYFSQIVKTSSYLIPGFSSKINNTNYLINDESAGSNRRYYYKYAVGSKTGSTSAAGKCLVSRAKKGNDEFIVIALGGSSTNGNTAMLDSIALYDYAFENYTENIDIITPKYQSVNINDTILINYDIVKKNTTMDEVLTWKSLDPEIASVNKNGLVKGLKLGMARIKVESQTGNYSIINVSVGFYNGMYIDYSYFNYINGNKENIDFNILKDDGFDYVVIRNDEMLLQNIESAYNSKINFTLCYLAKAKNVSEAENEAMDFINIINNQLSKYKSSINMPLVYDMYSSSTSRNNYSSMSKDETTSIALAFYNKLKEEGYNLIIYNGRTAFNDMNCDVLRNNGIGIYAIYRNTIVDSYQKLRDKMQTVSGLDVDMWEYTYDEYLSEALSFDATYLSLMYMGNIVVDEVNNGSVNVKTNDKVVSVNIKPNEGYKLDIIKASSTLYDYSLNKENDNLYTFKLNNDFSDIHISVLFKAIKYKLISGNKQVYDNNDLIFKINGNTSLINKIMINNKELLSSDYEIINDEIIIFKDYIDLLNSGKYNIKFILFNDTSVTGEFIINEEKEDNTKLAVLTSYDSDSEINNKKNQNDEYYINEKDNEYVKSEKKEKCCKLHILLIIIIIIVILIIFKKRKK